MIETVQKFLYDHADLKSEFSYHIINYIFDKNPAIFSEFLLSTAETLDLKTENYIDFLRDLAIYWEKEDVSVSMKLMLAAFKLRPRGLYINKKLICYLDSLRGDVNIVINRAKLFHSLRLYSKKVLMTEIAKRNSDLSFDSSIKFDFNDKDKVTIVSAVSLNPFDAAGKLTSHFMSIMGYALSIASSNFTMVNIVFTNEWDGNANSINVADKLNSLNLAKETLKTSRVNLDKIKFTVLLTPTELPNHLYGTIIKLKSVAENLSSYIYDSSIYNNFPVIKGTFNSHYLNSENCDYLLVRSEANISNDKALYVPPSLFNFKTDITNNESKRIFTAYTSNRLQLLLDALTEEEWNKLTSLFLRGYIWVLAGYDKPDDLYRMIPNKIRENFPDSIEIHRYLDLDIEFKDSYALLCSPLFRGGGGTARQAISYLVPVLCSEAIDSDIATILPKENLSKDLSEQLDLILKWTCNDKLREKHVSLQTELFKTKSDLQKHKSNLPEVIVNSQTKYSERLTNEDNLSK